MATSNQLPVGGLVARFQGQRLHPGWIGIIDQVLGHHAEIVIMLGVHGGLRTKQDPLTFHEREHMIRESFPGNNITIIPLPDNPISSARWSRNLDKAISALHPKRDIVLYGSRDSFIPSYTGRFKTCSVSPTIKYSGTELRRTASMPTTEEGRAGIIHAINTRPDLAYSTVDVAIMHRRRAQVLLIGKSVFDELLAFPGGFLDPTDESHAHAALRERNEEVLGIETGPLTWVGQTKMNDPRYRNSTDGTHTTLFVTDYNGGTPRCGDDAESIGWINRSDLSNVLVPWHKPLAKMLEAHW